MRNTRKEVWALQIDRVRVQICYSTGGCNGTYGQVNNLLFDDPGSTMRNVGSVVQFGVGRA